MARDTSTGGRSAAHAAAGPRKTDEPVIRISAAVKRYGPTLALNGVDLEVAPGEILGVVGHNGAGKSTLMRVISGIEAADSGSVKVGGKPRRAREGFACVRMAYQETSLAPELTVAQNIYLSSASMLPGLGWRQAAAGKAVAALDEIFPGHGVHPGDYVDSLSIGARQMVEIARAVVAEDLRVLILDEPTESLTRESADALYAYVRRIAADGVAVVLVSHRLNEVLSVCHRVAVLKDGAVVSEHDAASIDESGLFAEMGGDIEARHIVRRASTAATGDPTVRVPVTTVQGAAAEIVARPGEVIGLAGIAGQGQEEILERLWRGSRGVRIGRRRAYVPGDRQRSGILPLWDVAGNLTISAMRLYSKAGVRSPGQEAGLVGRWVDRLAIRGGAHAAITSLSGGNQQKVIVSRAFASDADTILLDDPFRGVDVHTKADLYGLIRDEAERGRTIIWYSSENTEMAHCDRVYVLRAGRLAGELVGDDIDEDRIIAMSFAVKEDAKETA